MTKLILEIRRQSDLDTLLPLLRRLRIRFFKIESPSKAAPEIEEAIRIVRLGCDMSNFGDVMDWQKEARKDRELPYRD